MIKKCIPLLICLFAAAGFSQNTSAIDALSKSMGFTFTMPAGYREVPLTDQQDLLVNIAFKKGDNEEYRLGIYPMSRMPKSITTLKSEKELQDLLYSMTNVICLNIARKKDLKPKIRFFDKKEVWSEFGAHMGTYVTVRGNSDFSKGYSAVSVNTIYRKNRGMIAIYVLIKDLEKYIKNYTNKDSYNAFYCVKFQ